MRTEALVLTLSVLTLSVLGVAGAWAQEPSAEQDALRAEFVVPDGIVAGDRTGLLVRVRGDGGHPLLLTPRSEGAAIELARGRLTHSDATPGDGYLELRIPIIANEPGPATVHIHVAGYRCEQLCRAVSVETSLAFEVGRGAE